MNLLCLKKDIQETLNQVYKTWEGDRKSLIELVELLTKYLSKSDHQIEELKITFGQNRKGNASHSLECIDKPNLYLNYYPSYKIEDEIKGTVQLTLQKV